MQYYACSEFGWSLDYVTDEVPMLRLMLLLNQRNLTNCGGMSLTQKEEYDNLSWDELLARNQAEMRRRIASGEFG